MWMMSWNTVFRRQAFCGRIGNNVFIEFIVVKTVCRRLKSQFEKQQERKQFW